MEQTSTSELIYQLEDRPPVLKAIFAASQHLLASFVGIVTPSLVIGGVLGLENYIPYLVSMALIASGIGTFIQSYRPFGIGAGMLCVQGTSFSFLGAILGAGFLVRSQGGSDEQVISLIVSLSLVGSLVQMGLSLFIPYLTRVITPLVTGIVITTIGLSLIKVGMTDLAGGYQYPDFGNTENLLLGLGVIAVILALSVSRNHWLRMSSIIIGLFVGSLAAWLCGYWEMNLPRIETAVHLPVPFQFGFSFDGASFVVMALIYVISSIETAGDLTANCVISRQAVSGPGYLQRIKSGVFADGVNSLIAALCNSFPNTTFSQNSGVIQLTGIASRYVGCYVAAGLVLLGLLPAIGSLLQQVPKPVLGGATLVMFGTIAAAGIKIISTEQLDRRKMMIIAVAFGFGFGTALVPELLAKTPQILQNIFSSPVAAAGLSAIVLSLLLPEPPAANQQAGEATAAKQHAAESKMETGTQ
ncbi:purine permease [Aestuariicella hydrocarbonica]|uniref:Purine permease n=1 Tax=Pseudomaricurvus hydrocarbonicus TaxID=1470433 RepID=A0A9E5JXB9_9GAMM|nr:nucleobase:cation symporter-2 family protein [Aestuariicella hydrocarbonica]NHO66240.1 purine permease [Aestuariicella hydrocarbonica]